MFVQILNLTIISLFLVALVNHYVSALNATSERAISVKTPLEIKQGFLSDVVSSDSLITKQPQMVSNPEEIARGITVRVITNPGSGSGVIVNRTGKIYTVLTNEHVVVDTWDHHYMILTGDGLNHPAHLVESRQFSNLDLAIVQFSSDKSYQLAQLGNLDHSSLGQTVYAAGFPNWHLINSHTPINTISWGLKALKITTGTIKILTNLPLSKGYQLGYTNDIENGMSGGPVLDAHGHLIGINGRLKHPFNGISSYVFTDGSRPSQEQFLKMAELSWGIPVNTVQKLHLFSNPRK